MHLINGEMMVWEVAYCQQYMTIAILTGFGLFFQ